MNTFCSHEDCKRECEEPGTNKHTTMVTSVITFLLQGQPSGPCSLPAAAFVGPTPRTPCVLQREWAWLAMVTPTRLSGLTFHRSTKHLPIPPSVSHLHILWFQITDLSCSWRIQRLCFCFLFSLLFWSNSEKREAKDIIALSSKNLVIFSDTSKSTTQNRVS